MAGSLVCVGSGIKGVGHFTLEAQGWIEQADLVVYCVADPVTEIWVQDRAKESFDLYRLYGNDKPRISTYEEMAAMMVDGAREGKDVCAVFYGHPGVFVLPTHLAIRTLRKEGIPATMLPAVSALDCLFADVGVDPAQKGCQTVEATDLLLRRRPLLTESHVVIWQIGCVGDLGFRFAGYDNRNLGVFVEYLLEFYEPSQQMVHYQASQYAGVAPAVDRITLSELVEAQVTGISTLYIPPVGERATVPEMVTALGLRLKGQAPQGVPAKSPQPAVAASGGAKPDAAWKKVVPLKTYVPTRRESILADSLAELACSPEALAEFERDPARWAAVRVGMTRSEREALVSRHGGRIRMALKGSELPALDDIDRVHGASRAGTPS